MNIRRHVLCVSRQAPLEQGRPVAEAVVSDAHDAGSPAQSRALRAEFVRDPGFRRAVREAQCVEFIHALRWGDGGEWT